MNAAKYQRSGMVLAVAGTVLCVVGAIPFIGNKTGLFVSFPFAGTVTGGNGGLLASIGMALVRGEPLRRSDILKETRRTSPVVIAMGLLLLAVIVFGALLR